MLGRQSSILVTNDDLRELEAMLLKRGDVVLLSDKFNEGRNTLLPLEALELAHPGKESLFCYLAPASTAAPNIVIHTTSDVRVDVEIDQSEIIELWRSYCFGDVIRRGRFFYTARYYEAGNFYDKDPEFVSWAAKVAGAIRRSLDFDKALRTYVGTDAARKIASGELKVIV
jgi:hypothetical protein